MKWEAGQINGQNSETPQPLPGWPVANSDLRCRSTLTENEWKALEEHAYRWGSHPESYDIVVSGGAYLRSPCGQATVSILPHRRYWHIPGGLLAPPAAKQDAIDWLKQVARHQNVTQIVYAVTETDAQLFQQAGFETTKFGEEPVLDLGDITWRGKAFDWVRRQTNYCRRQGLLVEEIPTDSVDPALCAELTEILHEDLSHRTYSRPLKLLEGEFDPQALYRRRLFLARSQTSGRIEGFLSCSPMHNGQVWGFETYRKRADAVRGTMPFLFREVVDRLQSEGATQVSLCVVPGKGVAAAPATRKFVRTALSMWYSKLEFLFNARGQDYFKSRFRPRFENRYICVTPRSTIRSMASFLKVAGALQPNVRNLLRNTRRAHRIRQNSNPGCH